MPALRQWLSRKQREHGEGGLNCFGRPAAAWNARPEWRQLPTPTEGLRILGYTRRRHWTASERRKLTFRNWLRIFRPMLLGGVFVMIGGLLLWALVEWAIWLRVHTLVETLNSAAPAEVAGITKELKPFNRWAKPRWSSWRNRPSPAHAPAECLPGTAAERTFVRGLRLRTDAAGDAG